MTSITAREFRSNMASMFNRIDAGEQILVTRNNRRYTIVPVEDDDLAISPELMARIEKSRKQIAEGKCYICRNKEELNSFLDSL